MAAGFVPEAASSVSSSANSSLLYVGKTFSVPLAPPASPAAFSPAVPGPAGEDRSPGPVPGPWFHYPRALPPGGALPVAGGHLGSVPIVNGSPLMRANAPQFVPPAVLPASGLHTGGGAAFAAPQPQHRCAHPSTRHKVQATRLNKELIGRFVKTQPECVAALRVSTPPCTQRSNLKLF